MQVTLNYKEPEQYQMGKKVVVILAINCSPSLHKKVWRFAYSEGLSMTKYVSDLLDKNTPDINELEIVSIKKVK